MTVVLTAQQAANLRYRATFPDAVLAPVLLTDGRFGVSDAALTDPRVAQYRHLLKQGAIEDQSTLTFLPSDPYKITLSGRECYLSAAATAHAFGIPATNVYRFEIHRGESGYSGDAANGNRRAELVAGATSADRYGSGETLWVSFSFVVGPAHATFDTGGTLQLLHQWHSVDSGTARSPVLGVSVDGGNLRVYTRSDSTGSTAQNHYTVARPTDGVVHNVVISGLLGASGHLNVWLDGAQVVNVNTPIGYYNDDAGARDLAYTHFGMYQNNSVDPTVVFIANPEWGTTDLSARVASPLAVTVPAGGWV